MPESVLIAPAGEAVDIAHVKAHLRLTDTSQDTILPFHIAAARQFAEIRTYRSLLHTRYVYTLDAFPLAGIGTPLPFALPINVPPYAILLPRSPVAAVVSVQYTDMSGSLQTLSPSLYTVVLSSTPALITPSFGNVWPIVLPQIGSVQITYDAGYASPVVPAFTPGTLTCRGPVVWTVGQTVRLTNSGGALPAGLLPFTDYFIKTASAGVYTLSLTNGGAQVTFTDNGTGTTYFGTVPEGIIGWMLIRMGTLYEHREEVAILNRGKLEPLPQIDGLLDPYRVPI